MSGPVSRDSQARCAAPSHLYDAIRRPLRPPVLNEPSIDRLESFKEAPEESVQERLNRQMLERMRNLGLELPNDALLTAAQVGKYMVLALMLPPYMVVYGIPRWLMVTAFPNLAGILRAHAHRIGQLIQEWSNKILDLMKGVLEQTLGQALNLMRQAARQFLNASLEAWMKMMQQLQANIEKGVKAFTAPFRAIAQQFNRGSNALQEMIKTAGEWLTILAKGVRELPNGALEWMRRQMGKLAQVSQQLTNQIGEGRQAVAHFLSQKFSTLTAPLFNGFETIKQWGRSLNDKLFFSSPIETLEKIEQFRKKIKVKIGEIGEAVSKTYDRVVEKMENGFQQMGTMLSQTIHVPPQALAQAALWLYGLIPERRRFQVQRFGQTMQRFSGRMKHMFTGAKRGVEICGSFVTEAYKIIKTEISRWMAFVKRMIVRLYQVLLALPAKIWKGVKKVTPLAWGAIKGTVFAIRTFFAFLRALCVWGFSSTCELLHQYRLK